MIIAVALKMCYYFSNSAEFQTYSYRLSFLFSSLNVLFHGLPVSLFFRSCSRNPSESILARVKKLGQTFKEHYSLDTEDMPGSHIGTNTNAL